MRGDDNWILLTYYWENFPQLYFQMLYSVDCAAFFYSPLKWMDCANVHQKRFINIIDIARFLWSCIKLCAFQIFLQKTYFLYVKACLFYVLSWWSRNSRQKYLKRNSYHQQTLQEFIQIFRMVIYLKYEKQWIKDITLDNFFIAFVIFNWYMDVSR